MNIHFIQHESFEAPGAYLDWAEANGHAVSFTKVFQFVELPKEVDFIDLLIVMGGPQSPDTTLEDCPYFNAKREINFIKECMEQGKKVIGVCLGAQLIGEALGASFQHSPQKEIGNFPIYLSSEGRSDTNINHWGESVVVGHWHNDMPGLTPTSQILAYSAGCPRQIIRYTEKVYGFQCHLELNKEVAQLLIDSEVSLEQMSKEFTYVQSANDILSYSYEEMNQCLYSFLSTFTTS